MVARENSAVYLTTVLTVVLCSPGADPLPSWADGPKKKALLEFVAKVTDKSNKDYLKPADRIAVFDNDGTLWCEQPLYVQVAFTLDRVKALAAKHPEWKTKQPFQAVLENDLIGVFKGGHKTLAELVLATHSGITTDEFEQTVRDWIAKAKHPKFKRLYTECVYQPMLEVLAYLRANEFKTYIVSGGGVEFMRPWVEKVYGIPPEQVIGSVIKTKYEERDGKPALMMLPEVEFVNDKEGKPVAIHRQIGRRPVMAFGNSDGDYEMMRYVTAGEGPRFALIVHHTDDKREYAYDRESNFGKLDRALTDAKKHGWQVADMKVDWKQVFAFEK